MGVSRLLSYIKKNKHLDKGEGHLLDYVDLVQVAAERPGGIKLVIDFYSWEHYMNDNFKLALGGRSPNPYLFFYGGEYQAIKLYIESFVKALQSVHIELAFYLDGAKGTSNEVTNQKWNTWINRQSRDVKTSYNIVGFLNNEKPFELLDPHEATRPCLQEVQNIITLQQLGCEIHPCLAGEADTFIAHRLQNDENVYAVFTNDTDFCIFPDSVFLLDLLFDIDDDLHKRRSSMEISVPKKLRCGLVRSENLYKHFHFQSVSSLCEFAMIAGNDFTGPILSTMSAWKSAIGCNIIGQAVKLTRLFGTVEKCPLFAALMSFNQPLLDAVQHSRKFYSLTLPDGEEFCKDNPVLSVIAEGIKSSQIPSSILAMYQGFYWHRIIVEDIHLAHNTAERSLVHLRGHIYPLFLPPNVMQIWEYGRTFENTFEEMCATKVTYVRYPSLNVIHKNSFQANKMIFHNIMSHQEHQIPDFHSNSFFKTYGNKLGYKCYLLRYFLLLNWDKNLCVTSGEFLTLCVWVLGEIAPTNTYRNTNLIPSSRCVTVENWLLILFRTSYAFLGCLLGIAKAFPTPADIFSGAVWVSLYTMSPLVEFPHPCDQKFDETREQHVRDVVETIKGVLSEHKHVIQHIVKDVIPPTLTSNHFLRDCWK